MSSRRSRTPAHLVDGTADGAPCGHDCAHSAHDHSSCACVQACRQHVLVSDLQLEAVRHTYWTKPDHTTPDHTQELSLSPGMLDCSPSSPTQLRTWHMPEALQAALQVCVLPGAPTALQAQSGSQAQEGAHQR